jgi:hypothetical protein
MAKSFLYHLGMYALFQHQTGVGMPCIMKAYNLYADFQLAYAGIRRTSFSRKQGVPALIG